MSDPSPQTHGKETGSLNSATQDEQALRKRYTKRGMVIGLGIGAVLGAATGNLPVGIGAGIGVGIGAGRLYYRFTHKS